MRYLTWKLEFVSNILSMIVANIQQEDISKENHLQDGENGIFDIQRYCSSKKMKDNKRVFIVVEGIIKRLNGYVIDGKTGNCDVYVRQSNGAKVRCIVNHIKPVRWNNLDHIVFHYRK